MSSAAMPELSDKTLGPDFERIFRQYSPVIYRTARTVTGSPEDAQDIVQAIFLKLLRRDYPPEFTKSPQAYLYKAAVNMSLDVIRARQRRTFTHDVEHLETPVATAKLRFDEELHRRLHDVLKELNPKAAEILILRYVHNYSDAEISKLLGTSRGAIALRLFRLRARLKKLLRGPAGPKDSKGEKS